MKMSQGHLACALAAAVALAGCGGANPASEPGPASAPRATIVDAAPVERLQIRRSIDALGTLEARERVSVSAEVDGIIRSIHFKEGDFVPPAATGQVLIRLDATFPEMEVKDAEARLRMAETDLAQKRAAFERKRIMREENATTEAAFTDAKLAVEHAEAARAQAEAALDIARERLNRTAIRAPLSGVLGERRVSPGDHTKSGETLVEIVSIDPIEASFSVPEHHQADLRAGLRVDLETDALPGRQFHGEVIYVSPDVDVETRTIRLKARIPNRDRALKPGLFARVRLAAGAEEDRVVVPEEAVVPRGEKFMVYVVEGTTARARAVSLGQRLPGKVAILQGLDGTETVITAGFQRVSDGYPVEIRERGSQAP